MTTDRLTVRIVVFTLAIVGLAVPILGVLAIQLQRIHKLVNTTATEQRSEIADLHHEVAELRAAQTFNNPPPLPPPRSQL